MLFFVFVFVIFLRAVLFFSTSRFYFIFLFFFSCMNSVDFEIFLLFSFLLSVATSFDLFFSNAYRINQSYEQTNRMCANVTNALMP